MCVILCHLYTTGEGYYGIFSIEDSSIPSKVELKYYFLLLLLLLLNSISAEAAQTKPITPSTSLHNLHWSRCFQPTQMKSYAICFAYQCKHLQIENPLSILGDWFFIAFHYADGSAAGWRKMSAQAQQTLLKGSLLWHRQTSPIPDSWSLLRLGHDES